MKIEELLDILEHVSSRKKTQGVEHELCKMFFFIKIRVIQSKP